MNTFGQLKTYIENSLIESYGKKDFKKHFKFFKKNILESKELSEISYLYDTLSSPQNIDKEIVSEFLNECIENLKTKISSNSDKIDSLLSEISNIENNYEVIDNVIYSIGPDSILEKIESKNKIKSVLVEKDITKVYNENLSIPISSMSNIAARTFVKKYDHLNESDTETLKKYLTLSKDNLVEGFKETKGKVLSSLNDQYNKASDDNELKEKITETINKIENTKPSLYSLYQLEQLSNNL